MNIEDCYLVGKVGKPHGIRGEVKAYLDVDYIEEYQEMESVYALLGNKLTPFFIDQLRITGPNHVLIAFRNYTSREQAESLRNTELYLPLEALPELKPGQFYYHDGIGYKVEDRELGPLGEVIRFEELSPNDLLVMRFKGKEIYIPVSYEVVLDADHEERRMITRLPEGLLEVYLGD